jgi:CHAT domain-containing protein/lipopolysaccharide biosynthesis regulator YciM
MERALTRAVNNLETAINYLNCGQYAKALFPLESARRTFDKHRMEVDVATCDFNIGTVYQNLDQYDKAILYSQEAKRTFEKYGMVVEVARCDYSLANVQVSLGHHDQAIRFYQSARKVFNKYGMKVEVALCELNMGIVFHELGQYNQAIVVFQSVKRHFEENSMELEIANCNVNLGNAYKQLGHHDQAMGCYQSARKVFEKYGRDTDIATCYLNMATLMTNRDQHEQAIRYCKFAATIFGENGMEIGVAQSYQNMANAHVSLGHYDHAIELFQSAIGIFEKRGMEIDAAKCKLDSTNAYTDLGQYDQVILNCRAASKVFESHGMIREIAECNINSANAHQTLGEYDQSIVLYDSARRIFQEIGIEIKEAACNNNLANTYQELREYDNAIKLYQCAKEVFENNGMEMNSAICNLGMANTYLRLGRYDLAFALYRSSREVFSKYNNAEGIATCDLNIGNLYSVLGKYDQALSLFQEVNETYGHVPELKWKSLFNKGKAFRMRGEFDKARIAYNESIKVIESIRSNISQGEYKILFLESVYEVYYETIDYCLAQKDVKSALEYVERLKSRNLADIVLGQSLKMQRPTEWDGEKGQKAGNGQRMLCHCLSDKGDGDQSIQLKDEMENMYRKHEDIYDIGGQIEKISFEDIRGLVLDSETALLEIFPMLRKTIIFVVRKETRLEEKALEVIEVEEYNMENLYTCMGSLLQLYIKFRANENTKKEYSKWEEFIDGLLKELYEKLFLKVVPYLGGVQKIILIPYGVFHFLPLHAMFSEEDGERHYVIDDYLVTYAPSARILKQCRERNRVQKDKIFVAFANPDGTPLLPFSADEARAIKRLFKDTELILEATREDIINLGRQANIFHFTGHANLKALILHSEKDRRKPEKYLFEDIYGSLYLPKCFLAVLSACETGLLTNLRQVDEYIGLTSGLLHAGAATVISSLWAVSDISTTVIMMKMYELIKGGNGKADALREAQLWLKDPGKKLEHLDYLSRIEWVRSSGIDMESSLASDFSRPYYWAGFICSGVN